MSTLLHGISEHGYALLFAAVLLESIGIPIPAALAILIAGASAARGTLNPFGVAGSALGGMILGDWIMFLLGRYTGWWLLGVLCRISLNPESCVLSSAASFYKRGRVVLLFAKFVPGINTMAPPLAGSMNMRPIQFLGLDSAGAALYTGAYLSIGYLFGGALAAILSAFNRLGQAMEWTFFAAVIAYLCYLAWIWAKSRKLRTIPMVVPTEAARVFDADAAVIYDVRSHGYYDREVIRIRGSKRLEPNAIHLFEEHAAESRQIFLYCTCLRDATSARVAHALREKGVATSVIEGGLRAWIKAGLPTEVVPVGEMIVLPSFR